VFGVIMNTERVATCLPLNGVSMLRQFVSLVTVLMCYSSTVVVKHILNPFRMRLNSISILLLSIGRNLSRPILALQI